MVKYIHPNTRIEKVEVFTDREALLEYEREANKHPSKDNFEFPIPEENRFKTTYFLTGEWIFPLRDSRWGKWFSSDSMKSPPTRRKVIFYIHGGAYAFGTPELYRTFTGNLVESTGCSMFAIQYRLAPEDPFPAGLHDVFAGYLWLTNPNHASFARWKGKKPDPIDPNDIILMGDSAGGGMLLSLLIYLKNYLVWPNRSPFLKLPRAAVTMSPWVDLSCRNPSWRENAKFDWLPSKASDIHQPFTSRLESPVKMYIFGQGGERTFRIPLRARPSNFRASSSYPNLGLVGLLETSHRVKSRKNEHSFVHLTDPAQVLEYFVSHPLVSPLKANLTGLPPMLCVSSFLLLTNIKQQVGEVELLADDTTQFVKKYREQNANSVRSQVKAERYTDMVHVFQAMNFLEASKMAIARISKYIIELEREDEEGGRVAESRSRDQSDDNELITAF